MKKIVSLLLVLAPAVQAGESVKITRRSCVFSSVFQKPELLHNGSSFLVSENGRITEVGAENISPELRKATDARILSALLRAGKIEATKAYDGSVILRHRVSGIGGGPLTAWFLYGLTKSVCYGTAVAATGVVVVGTGGLGAATGALVAGGTLTASAGATVVAGTIAGAGLTAEAGLASAAFVTAAGGVPAAIAAIETGATAAWIAGMACPWLP
jgi:hypothetical protein